MHKIINNNIFSIDIENSKGFTPYLFGISEISFYNMPKCDYTNINTLSKYYALRRFQELDFFLYNIVGYMKTANIDETIFYIHNMKYEFSYFVDNMEIFKHIDFKCSMFESSHAPIVVVVNIDGKLLKFIDTFRISRKSIKKLGAELNYPKLELEGNYTYKYHSNSILPINEFEYNKRDTQIVLLYLCDLIKNHTWINSKSRLTSFYTSTMLGKADCKHNPIINLNCNNKKMKMDSYTAYCKACQMNAPEVEWLDVLEKSFQGGFTFANPMEVFKLHKNVYSYDITSSYPTEMLQLKYFHAVENVTENKVDIVNYIHSTNLRMYGLSQHGKITTEQCYYAFTHYLHYLKNGTVTRGFFVGEIVLNNLQPRCKGSNLILPLSISKCQILDDNGNWRNITYNDYNIHNDKIRVCNGKVLWSKVPIKTFCDSNNLLAYNLYYEFDIINALQVLKGYKFSRVDRYVSECVKYYATIKNDLKKVKEKIENTDNYIPNKKDFPNVPKDVVDKIFSGKNTNEIIHNIDTEYKAVKGSLNGQYGTNVQKLRNDNYIGELQNNEYYNFETTEGIYKPNKLSRNYVIGLQIPSYARLNLLMTIWALTHFTKTKFLYCDTDSIKICGDIDRVNDFFNRLNMGIKYYATKCCTEKLGYLGLWDNEYPQGLKYFQCNSAKNYLYSKDGKTIKCTIAGCNPRELGAVFTELYQNDYEYDIDTFIEECYKPNTYYDYTVIKKLGSKYYDRTKGKITNTITDENGLTYTDTYYPGCELIEMGFDMISTKTLAFNIYVGLIELLQGRNIPKDNTYIICNKGVPSLHYGNIKKSEMCEEYELFPIDM